METRKPHVHLFVANTFFPQTRVIYVWLLALNQWKPKALDTFLPSTNAPSFCLAWNHLCMKVFLWNMITFWQRPDFEPNSKLALKSADSDFTLQASAIFTWKWGKVWLQTFGQSIIGLNGLDPPWRLHRGWVMWTMRPPRCGSGGRLTDYEGMNIS